MALSLKLALRLMLTLRLMMDLRLMVALRLVLALRLMLVLTLVLALFLGTALNRILALRLLCRHLHRHRLLRPIPLVHHHPLSRKPRLELIIVLQDGARAAKA
jgi:hypothetical protein